ncbi:MAG: nucleotidyltransferase domain-containing protein [Firmicutes bacterium]|nr:nucleotidyltransferase domain-containing protein [Bacillota bacterium]
MKNSLKMNDIIRQTLTEIEKQESIKIIFAVESGSRAWGFSSPDSDYDVRFIYVRPTEHYLKLERKRDVIEWQLDETLDINGWDFQKTLRLLHSSNPTLFEWSRSPIVYKDSDDWQRLMPVINDYFLAKSGVYHYLHMAARNNREFLQLAQVKLKKYFYVLRPILACKWILDKNSPPPMIFTELAAAELEDGLKPVVSELLDKKINLPEIEMIPRIDALNEYIDREIQNLRAAVAEMPEVRRQDYSRLNEIFLQAL